MDLIHSINCISDKLQMCLQGWEYFHHSEKCYKLVNKSYRKMADAETHCQRESGLHEVIN